MIDTFLLCEKPYIDLYTCAYAWVLFEKLVYLGVVRKLNRKLMVVMCILIAFKSIEVYGGFEANKKLFQKLKTDF